MSTISPNMNLPVPTPSVTPGPDWATEVVADMYAIDSHDHTTGKGVPITPDGLSISSDLSMGNNNLTVVRSVNFTAQAAPLALAADLGCIYVSGADLYYNDEAGNQVRITQGGAVTGSSGTITGLPSGTASASYAAGTFTFQSATSTPANMAVGPIAIGRNTASSKTVTLTPNAGQASNYGIGFPAALPAATNYTTLDASGNLSFNSSGTTGTGAVVLATSPTITTPTVSSPTITGTITGTITTSGVINTADGAAGAPAYSFSSDTDTGFYRTGSGSVAYSGNATASVVLNTVGASFLDGTAAAPSINFNADTDNGFYRAATNTIGIAAGGVVAATVEADALHLSGYLETAGGGIFKTQIYSGSLTASASRLITIGTTILGATGRSTFNGSSGDWQVMTTGGSSSTSNRIYFTETNTDAVNELTWSNADSNSTNSYQVIVFYQ